MKDNKEINSNVSEEDEAIVLGSDEEISTETLKGKNEDTGKGKRFFGMVKKQKIMIVSFASFALVMTVLYLAVFGPMLKKAQEPEQVIPPVLVDGEVYDDDGVSILIFPHIEKKNIKSIAVNNSFGSFKCIRADEENAFYIEEHMQAPFSTETLTQLVVDAGYPTIIKRLYTEGVDWSLYGLAEEDEPSSYTVTTLDDVSHTVYIGDRTLTEGGFYCRYKDRDALYVITSEVEYTLLSPVTSLLTPMLGYPIAEAETAKIDECTLLKNGKPFISINYKPIEGTEMALSSYEMIYPANYIVNDENYATTMLLSLSNLQGYSVVAAGTPDKLIRNDEEIMAKYGFYDLQNAPYELYYTYGGENTIIAFTESGMDGYYFAYSYLYDIIVLIEKTVVQYLEWDLLKFIDSSLFSAYIADVDSIKIEGSLEYKKQVYNINEKFLYRQVQVGTATKLQCTALSTGRIFTGNNPDQNPIQELYGTILTMKIQGYMKDEGVDVSGLDSYAKMTITKLNGESVVYEFFRYSSERCFYTVNGEGEFYMLRRQVDKLMIDAVRSAHGLRVESNNEYADLPEGFMGSEKYE